MQLKRSFTLYGQKTSIALEPEFWEALGTLAADHDCTLSTLITKVEAGREPEESLASTLRVFALLNRAA